MRATGGGHRCFNRLNAAEGQLDKRDLTAKEEEASTWEESRNRDELEILLRT